MKPRGLMGLMAGHEAACSYNVPPVIMGTDNMLGRFKRELERKSTVLFKMKNFKSLETATDAAPLSKRSKVAEGFELVVVPHDVERLSGSLLRTGASKEDTTAFL